MTREDTIAVGMEAHEIQHSMKRRTPWHDYSRKGTYMLTLVVEGRVPLLGEVKGEADAPPGSPAAPYVECSALGNAILREELWKIHHFYPQVEVWKVCIMPDHLHMIVRVNEDMGKRKHLGQVVAGFKGGCSKAAMKLRAQSGHSGNGNHERATAPCASPATAPCASPATVPCASPATVPCASPATAPCASAATVPCASAQVKVTPLFEDGYCDKILLHEGQLDNWKRYLDDNPRRLLVKRQNPHLFTVLHGMEVAGEQCQIVGNRFLLDIPDKMAVIVHRRYTDEENARLREAWLSCGERGGVLVSAAISPKEKEVLREAMNRGYNIILLRENGFPKLYKPAGEAFDACASGLLLQISPWEFHMERKTITRTQCLHLNAMAERITANE